MTTASRVGESVELPRRDLRLGRAGPLDLGVRIVGTQPEYKWAAVDSNHLPPRCRGVNDAASYSNDRTTRRGVISSDLVGVARQKLVSAG